MITHPKPVKAGPLIVLMLCLLLAGMALVFYIGNILTAPRQSEVDTPDNKLPFESIVIERDAATPLQGWFLQGERAAAMILLHGIRSDRREMLARAEFLHDAGYSVFMPDLQAHGATIGQRITWGFRESRDVQTALSYIRQRLAGQPVGIIGVSMGGAACLLGDQPVTVDALILESVYSNIEQAVENRLKLRLGKPGQWLTPLLTWQIEAILGISLTELSPLAAIGKLKSPVLIVAGTHDLRTTRAESQALYEAAPGSKALWLIEGARHQNLHRYAPLQYQQNVLSFLEKHLNPAKGTL